MYKNYLELKNSVPFDSFKFDTTAGCEIFVFSHIHLKRRILQETISGISEII